MSSKKESLSEPKLNSLISAVTDSFDASGEASGDVNRITTLWKLPNKDKTVAFSLSKTSLMDLEDALIKSNNYHFYSNGGFQKYVIDCIGNSMETWLQDESRERDLVQFLSKSLKDEIKSEPLNYKCIVPVTGVGLKEPFEANPVKFYPYEDKEKVINVLQEKTGQKLLDARFKSNFSVVELFAKSSRNAAELAIEIVRGTLDALQVLKGNLDYPFALFAGDLPIQRSIESIALSNVDGITAYDVDNFPAPLMLNKKIHNPYLDEIGNIQQKMIKQTKLTILERNFYNANRLISQGIASDITDIRFTNLMSSVEALVEQKRLDQSITTQVSESVAILIGQNAEQKLKIFEDMKRLYKIRSDVAHGEITYISMQDLHLLLTYIRFLLTRLLNDFDKFDNENAIQNYVTQRKLGFND